MITAALEGRATAADIDKLDSLCIAIN